MGAVLRFVCDIMTSDSQVAINFKKKTQIVSLILTAADEKEADFSFHMDALRALSFIINVECIQNEITMILIYLRSTYQSVIPRLQVKKPDELGNYAVELVKAYEAVGNACEGKQGSCYELFMNEMIESFFIGRWAIKLLHFENPHRAQFVGPAADRSNLPSLLNFIATLSAFPEQDLF